MHHSFNLFALFVHVPVPYIEEVAQKSEAEDPDAENEPKASGEKHVTIGIHSYNETYTACCDLSCEIFFRSIFTGCCRLNSEMRSFLQVLVQIHFPTLIA